MWSVAITTPKCEFDAAQDLGAQGVETFLPYTVEKTRVRLPVRGRAVYKVQTLQKPRWPGYLFTRSVDRIDSRFVRRLVSFGGEPAHVSDKVMDTLRRGCLPCGRIVYQASLYAVGDILRLIAPSPLAGRSGVVLRLDDNSVVLSVGAHSVASPYAEVA